MVENQTKYSKREQRSVIKFLVAKKCKPCENKRKMFGLVWFCWVGFYDISTIIGYLMPNPVYTYILNHIWFVNTFCR